MRIARLLSLIALPLLLMAGQGCRNTRPLDGGEKVDMRHAEGFTVARHSHYTVAEVRDPWDTTRLLQRYILIDKESDLPASLPVGTVVRTPVERMVVYSSVHGAMLDALGLTPRIVGVCEAGYYTTPPIRKDVASGRIADVGNATTPDIEKIIDLSPDAIWTSPFENSGYGRVEKIGVPIIECADYMENTPLGRAEWIRFIALFTGKEAVADSLFAHIEAQYLALQKATAEATHRPTVIAEKKTGTTWFVPGGRSYMARLFADAGADYHWKDDTHTGSLAHSFETIFDRAQKSDFWVFKYTATADMNLSTLAAEYAPYRQFAAFESGHIFGCNLTGSPIFEETPLYPHLLLKEFILIFHPELFPGEKFRYYHRLQP